VNMLQALTYSGIPTLLRTAALDYAQIGKVLDAGAHGVIVPMINTAEEASKLVDATRYPPLGRRSWGPTRPLMTMKGYSPASANAKTICGVQIETAKALDNLDAIFAVNGVDMAMVGPYDLAISLGISPGPGIINADHRRALVHIANAAARHGVVPAIFGPDATTAMEFQTLGYTAITVAHDAALLSTLARRELEIAKAMAKESR
jgi:4-hydroxy-2-oxoheptanedioate aldolase